MIKLLLSFISILFIAVNTYAIPILQVDASAGSGDIGIYADYQVATINPPENDTAITSGALLYVAGAYKNNPQLLIGGQYSGTEGTGLNWSDFGFNSAFNTHRAVLMATVPDGTLGGGSLTVNGFSPFYTTAIFESGFVMPNPPSNHAPVKDQDYLFFDIGDFAKNPNAVPNFADETGLATGEIKTLAILASNFAWIHLDAFALVTDLQGGGPDRRLVTNLDGNSGSHDVTWKEGNGHVIPEPKTVVLLGGGLLWLALYGRKF
ncbi:MAG: choice-of-anchor N protein [Nitrospirae bacterium]|nr:choice-of-anchor N protein [Nitrospirota bacterium]